MRFRLPLLSLLFLSSFGSAQSSEANLTVKLVGKPLFLRGFWAADKLRFDSSGVPLGRFATTSFTVSGVRVRTVQLQADNLRLEGIRECLLFEEDGSMERVPLRGGNGKKPEELKIEIKASAGQDYAAALHAIFADNLVELIPSMPPFWQRYAQANFTKPQEVDDDPDSPRAPDDSSSFRKVMEPGAAHVGGTVKAPKVTHSENPQITDYARRMMVQSGTVQVYLWVEEDGSVSHVSIAKPAGLGFDEAAVASVMKYRFKPASRNGNPVKVYLFIDASFQTF